MGLSSISTQLQGQIKVSSFFNNLGTKVGVGLSISKIFSLDANLYATNIFGDISPEFTIRGNLFNFEEYKIYVGAGVATNRLASWVFPMGVDATVFPSINRLSFRFETIIMAGMDGNPNLLLPTLGLTYRLSN